MKQIVGVNALNGLSSFLRGIHNHIMNTLDEVSMP